jgi:hypothetical protein
MSAEMEARPVEEAELATTHQPVVREPMAGAGAVDPAMEASAMVPGARMALLAGLHVTLLGAWGALVAYFGPSFGFGPAGAAAWHWDRTNTFLNLVPGAAGVFAGLLMMLWAGARFRAPMLSLAALIAFAAGAWFVLGPEVYPVLHGTVPNFGAVTGPSGLAHFTTRVGYGLGVGLLMCLLAGMVLAVAPFRPVLMRREMLAPEGRRHPVAL